MVPLQREHKGFLMLLDSCFVALRYVIRSFSATEPTSPSAFVGKCGCLIALLLYSVSAYAQYAALPQAGIPGFTAFQHSDIDSVNLQTGNVNVHIPLVSFPQLGDLKLDFVVRYNEPQWTVIVQNVAGTGTQARVTGRWNLGIPDTQNLPRSIGPDIVRTQGVTPISYYADTPCVYQNRYVYCDHDGYPGDGGTTGETDGQAYFTTGVRDRTGAEHILGDGDGSINITAPDGSGWLPVTQTNTGYATYVDRNGIRYSPGTASTIGTTTDAHGNVITSTPSGWTDSVNRSIPGSWTGVGSGFEADPFPGVVTSDFTGCLSGTTAARVWIVPSGSQQGGTSTYRFCYANTSYQTAFGTTRVFNLPAHLEETSGQFPLLTRIVLPNNTSYDFSYDTYLELQQISFPTGGYVQYHWSTVQWDNCGAAQPVKRAVQSRTVFDGTNSATWTYQWDPPSICYGRGMTSSAMISKPDGNDEYHHSDYGLDLVKYYSGRTPVGSFGTAGALVKTVSSTLAIFTSPFFGSLPVTPDGNGGIVVQYPNFIQDQFNGPATAVVTTLDDGSVSEVDSQLVPNGGTVTWTNPGVNLQWDQAGLTGTCQCINYPEIAGSQVYDYGSGSHGALLSSTLTSYAYTGDPSNLIDLTSHVTLQDASGNTSAKTDYKYDEPSRSPGDHEGDLTTVTRWIDSVNSTAAHTNFNSVGLPTSITNGNGTVTNINSYQCSGLFPQQVSLAYQTALQETQSYGFDCNTGKVTSYTDPNANTTTYTYNDPLNRLTNISYPDGGSFGIQYVDGSSSNATLTTATGGPQGPLVQTIAYDGLGRTTDVATQGGSAVDTLYDAMGRVSATSNPHTSSTNPTDGWTSNAYDSLGRKRFQCNADNGTAAGNCSAGSSYREWSYVGAKTTEYDENRSMWTRSYDGAGRLTSVTEPNSAVTNYTYYARGDLKQVTQTGTASSASSITRTFSYDWLSRLNTASNPETGPVCYGQGSGANCTNGYDADGNLLYKMDARGILTTQQYDALDRLLSKAHSDGTPTTLYGYDGKNASGTSQVFSPRFEIGRLSASSNGTRTERQYGYDPMGRLTLTTSCTLGDCSFGSGAGAWYDLAGNPIFIEHPDQFMTQQTYDNAGRLSSVVQVPSGRFQGNQTFVQSISYNPDDSPNVMTLGNDAVQSVTKNNRLQVQAMTATSRFFSTPLLSHQYCYVNGPNCPVAGSANNGNIWGIIDTLNTAKSQIFGYDSL